MSQSRRAFFKRTITTGSIAPFLAVPGAAKKQTGDYDGLAAQVLEVFAPFPGNKAVKIWAPATDREPEFLAKHNSAQKLFVGSAIKTFVLCEALRQVDSPDVVKQIVQNQLTVDPGVWSLDSATFNPPNLSGSVSERTALEAMILHSDNTGTDMSIRQAGIGNIRDFIASIGLKHTQVPDSTRSFFGYLFGVPNYLTLSWDELSQLSNSDAPIVNSPLNSTETLASSASDFVSYYSRALQGKFFKEQATLQEFRRILSIGDAIAQALPLGVSAFAKGGSIDVPGFHCMCIAGGMFFSNRWVYYALIINWDAPGQTDLETTEAYVAAVLQALTLTKEGLCR